MRPDHWILAGAVSLCFFLGILAACRKDAPDPSPSGPTPYHLEIPAGFPEMSLPSFNKLTVEGIALGRKLYYDNILSMNGLSCSSCHDQQQSFTQPFPGPGERSILVHVNLGWHQYFGWEGAEEILDHVPLADLEDGNPFLNANHDSLYIRFKNHPLYPGLFQKAFGIQITEVSEDQRKMYIAYALAQFLRTLISGDNRFDKLVRHEGGDHFTASEMNGMSLFFGEGGDCFHCHGYPLLTNGGFHNNGLDSVFNEANYGLFAQTGNPSDLGKFRVPTLRNIALSAPYMHDGRFWSLEEVVDFYDAGLYRHGNTDPLLQRPSRNLTPGEKADLVAFLRTFTDSTFIFNKNFSNPN